MWNDDGSDNYFCANEYQFLKGGRMPLHMCCHLIGNNVLYFYDTYIYKTLYSHLTIFVILVWFLWS